ncbi:hypothetical protein FRB99_002295 [Tulasnella sp. 403]|nr:hypothetical protein FRB99_002295 [Tulasnella sp. 403]
MTSQSPNGLVSHPDSDEDERVVFRTPSEASRNGTVGAKRSSLGVGTPQHNFFSPSPLSMNGKEANNGSGPASKSHSPASAGSWQQNDPTQELAAQVQSIALSDGADKTPSDGNGILAPAAEIKEQTGGHPHSRNSSAGDSSNFDSPAIPTPGQARSSDTTDRTTKAPFPINAFQNGYGPFGYDNHDTLSGMNGVSGMSNGHITSPGAPLHQPHPATMSPLAGGVPHHLQSPPHVPIPFSPHLGHLSHPDTQMGGFAARTDDFSVGYGMQGRMNGRPAMGNRAQQNGAVNSTTPFPSLMGQQATTTPFSYGSPPSQTYPAGLMSPTITSPTFLPNAAHNPYASPIPTPYSPYAPPPALGNSGQMYDMMAGAQMPHAMSPPAGVGMLSGRTQNQLRGHGYSASNPPTLGDAARGLQQRQNVGGRQNQAPRNQQARSPQNSLMNHGHSMSLPHHPYSPQMTGSPYTAMSPTTFPAGFYGQIPPIAQQGLTPEFVQAVAMGMKGNYNNSMQSALTSLQKDPSVAMLMQQGGGPSANNRKLGLYKTELCRSWEEKGSCKYGEKCQFAHGDTEQRRVERHPKYKTEICRTFWVSGSCPYGKRCCFIHTELPANATANAAPGQSETARAGASTNNVAQAERPAVDGRARSMSTNSDPNEAPSLLARISARAQANNSTPGTNRSSDASPASATDIAGAIARAYNAYGRPGGQSSMETTPTEPTAVKTPTPVSSFTSFPARNSATPSGGIGGGHHRVSASVDFGRQGRSLGSDLSVGLGGGLGHQRNPSASSIVPSSSYSIPQLSRTPLSGQSSPFGAANETPNRSVAVGSSSSFLDSNW